MSDTGPESTGHFHALVSAGASALTAILAKLGVEGVPVDLSHGYQHVVVLVAIWLMVFVLSEQSAIQAI